MAVLGSKAVLGFSTAAGGIGAAGSATYTAAGNVRDVTFNGSKGEADVSTRAGNGWRAKLGTLKEGGLTFEVLWLPVDPFFVAVQAAWQNGTNLAMAILDGPLATGNGFEADMQVIDFEWSQPLEEGQLVSVTMSVTDSVNAPRFVQNGVGTHAA
jgi:hypothetical protein